MSDDELAELIGGLPRREPDSRLRDRALARAAGARGAARSLRPAVAFAVLALLLLVSDIGVIGWQDRAPASQSRAWAPVTDVRQEEVAGWAVPEPLLRLALEAERPAVFSPKVLTGDSYGSLRRQLAADRGVS
jgi:hypothetical protein